MRNKLLVAGTLALAITCTTVFSSITPAVVKAASVSTVQTQTAENSDDYVYCYAGLTWAEYWKAEGVMAAGDTTSSDTADNITSIKINGVEKTGKGGIKATDLFDADGNINFNAAIKGKDGSSTPVFADKSASYTIELTSTGYPSVSGTVQLNTSILEASIKKAEELDSSKYTAETWKALQTALTEAKEAKSANTQAIVDAANTKLTEALSGLKEKAVTPSKPATPSNPDTTTTKKPATKPALKKSNVKLSKPVLKVGKTTKNKAKVTWKKVKKATGYEIQYTTKGFGNKKATKTIKVSKAKITSAQLKKLKKKTRYKVRIRAVYTKAGYQSATSKWSAIKTVKTK